MTEGGSAAAKRLPYEHVHGSAGDTVRARWGEVDALVLFLAVGAAVRIIAPLLKDKRTDPAVICVDEACLHAVVVVGGHEAGGNDLCREVAAVLGATPVITTATDVAPDHSDRAFARIRAKARQDGLVVGVGTSSEAPADDVVALVQSVLAGLDDDGEVVEVATIDRRAEHPGVLALGLPVRSFTAEELAAVDVPTPSEAVQDAVGTPSVAEAAALLAAGPGAELVVPKQKNAVATAAVARKARRGRLTLVGLGPGLVEHRTPAAAAAVRHAEVVIGYGPYIDQCADLVDPARQEVVRSPIGDEVVRAKQSLTEAAAGRTVALVCSGDAGVYAMASIVLELADVEADVDVEVVPGVTAALASAAAVGAPLGHDHCAVSLSDLLTPWEAIERRLRAAADGDFVVSLYNPRSKGRDWQLPKAMEIIGAARPATTPVAVVTDAGRAGEQVLLTTIERFDPAVVGMTTCVIVGSSTTRIINGRMVTPRGYQC